MRKPIKRICWIVCIILLFLATSGLERKVYAEASQEEIKPVDQRFAGIPRPDPEGVPTKVRVMVYFLDVTEIDDIEQTFTADFYFLYRWNDPRLAAEGEADVPNVRIFEFDDIWHPYLTILNKRDHKVYYDETFQVDSSGNVQYVQRFYGKLSSPLNLEDFCFDQQTLPVIMASVRYHPEEVMLMVDEQSIGMREQFSIAGWSLKLVEPRVTKEYVAIQNQDIARVDIMLTAQRHTGYYFLKLLIPLSLIIFMAWAVFWIDPSKAGPQIGLPTSAVFTFILFNFRIGQILPRISYLTRIDRFVIGATFLVFMALGEAIATTILAHKENESLANKIDHVARYLYILLFGILIVVAFII